MALLLRINARSVIKAPPVPRSRRSDRHPRHDRSTGAAGPTGSIGSTGPQGPPNPATGPTGPTGFADLVGLTGANSGYTQHGNIIDNWGTVTATTLGATGTFARPYVDSPPVFTLSGATGATGSQPYVAAISRTGIFIRTQSGTATVNYRATGS